jgi:two-component system, cell cycle response regulator DivK
MSKRKRIERILVGWDVLVADDEPDSLMVAQTLLQMAGATVHRAADGAEALEMIRHEKLKFVISDLSMPVMDGWKLIEALRKDRRTNDLPVFALTAHAMAGDRQRAIIAGFTNYLTKPLDPAKFIDELLLLLNMVPELAEALTQMPTPSSQVEQVE